MLNYPPCLQLTTLHHSWKHPPLHLLMLSCPFLFLYMLQSLFTQPFIHLLFIMFFLLWICCSYWHSRLHCPKVSLCVSSSVLPIISCDTLLTKDMTSLSILAMAVASALLWIYFIVANLLSPEMLVLKQDSAASLSTLDGFQIYPSSRWSKSWRLMTADIFCRSSGMIVILSSVTSTSLMQIRQFTTSPMQSVVCPVNRKAGSRIHSFIVSWAWFWLWFTLLRKVNNVPGKAGMDRM